MCSLPQLCPLASFPVFVLLFLSIPRAVSVRAAQPGAWSCRTQPQSCRAPAAQLSSPRWGSCTQQSPAKPLEMPGFADPWASQSYHRAGSALPCAGTVLGFTWFGNDRNFSAHWETSRWFAFSFWAWIFFCFVVSLIFLLEQSPCSGCE